MGLQDSFLDSAANAISSSISVSYIGFSNQDGSVTNASSTLTNEIGVRNSITRTDSGRTVTFSGTRTAGDVVDTTNGDEILEIGFFETQSGDDLQVFIDSAGVTHTQNFDIEVTAEVEVTRG